MSGRIVTVVCAGRPGDPHRRPRLLQRLADERDTGGGFRPLPDDRPTTWTRLPSTATGKGARFDGPAEERIQWGHHRFTCPTCRRNVPLTDASLGRNVDAIVEALTRANIALNVEALGASNVEVNIAALR